MTCSARTRRPRRRTSTQPSALPRDRDPGADPHRHPALTRGLQLVRFAQDKPGLFAVSRFDPAPASEVLLLFNTSTQPIEQNVASRREPALLETLAGQCATRPARRAACASTLPPLGYAVCDAR
jgi:hypothetical protein